MGISRTTTAEPEAVSEAVPAAVPPVAPLTQCSQIFADTISRSFKYSTFSTSEIYNRDKFTLTNDFVPLVFYVHSRPKVFKKVIDSLRLAEGIEGTIIIVFFDDYAGRESYIQTVVSSIDFCQLIIVRSPPHVPVSNVHCISNWNSTYKTWYLKWHWLGLQSYMFKNILSMAPFHTEQDVLFMEEDHVFVSVDAYIFLKMLCRVKNSPTRTDNILPHISTVSLATPGGFEQNFGDSFGTKRAHEYLYHSVTISEHFSNTGYAYNRTFWEDMFSYEVKSPYPDWDWTLYQYLSQPEHLHENYHLRPTLNRIVNLGVYCSEYFGGSALHNLRPWNSQFNCSQIVSKVDFRDLGEAHPCVSKSALRANQESC